MLNFSFDTTIPQSKNACKLNAVTLCFYTEKQKLK